MAELVLSLGPTGSGKSFGIKTLNPDETVIINVNKTKKLPWKGSGGQYSQEKDNFFDCDKAQDIISLLKGIDKNGPHVKAIIIDDMRFVMEREYLAKAMETGYAKYTMLGKNFQDIIDTIGKMRDDIIVFALLHDEDVVNDKTIVGKKIKTVGALVDNHFNPLELVNIVLFTFVEHGKDGVKYGMYTQQTVANGAILPAKTPDQMFDTLVIPNDYQFACDKIREYYT
jgi:hypothetical protein